MLRSWILRRVALVGTNVSKESIFFMNRVTRIGELGTLADDGSVRYSEMSVLTRTTWRNITEDGIFHSHRRETLKS
jgi:hypothetical protein